MKKHIISPLIILISFFIIPSCEKNPEPDKEIPQIILREKSAQIIEADQAFAFELFREVIAHSDEDNIMISPLSVSYALGMTYNGAAGTTLDAFNNVLHFGDLTRDEVNKSYKDLMNQLVHLDEEVEFSIANSIWYRMGYYVLEDFITTNQEYFDAMVSDLDFSDPGAVDIINNWIEEKTNDKIQDMLDYIPGDAVMYLINAIYFNARWKYQFDPDDTQSGSFYLEDGNTHQADFMKINGDFRYTSNNYFAAVELPYGDSTFSMVVVLPYPGTSPDDLTETMDVTTWNEWFSHSEMANVQVEMPKFKYGFKDLLNDPLINLGLGIAFSGGADFTLINPDGNIFISRVIHQTFIDVQEEGTEAAAATIVELRETAGPPQPVVFRADKPFLYLIKENSTGAIMFMGKVGKPEYD
ncbi:MAG TPA: proteinase inhibitor I4 serpin [Bacteroidales bacterium]|nr:proteinase inhibitor I4 serpin [Bacteroidales bacterium]